MIDTIQKILQTVILAIVLALVACLIYFPDTFGHRAENVFLTLKKYNIDLTIGPDGPSVSYTEREVQNALETERDLDLISTEASCLSSQSCTPEEQGELALLLGLIEENDQKISENLTDQDTFEGVWIVIFGADRTIGAAGFELDKAEQFDYELDLIFVDGWYRSVAKFDTEADAQAAKPVIQVGMNRPDAYVRLLTRWCSNHVRVDGNPSYIKCGANWN